VWVVVVAGVFSIVTLLMKSFLDAGGRRSRQRRTLQADVELLNALPDSFVGKTDFQALLENSLTDYLTAGTRPIPRSERGRLRKLLPVIGVEGTKWFAAAAVGLVGVAATGIGLMLAGPNGSPDFGAALSEWGGPALTLGALGVAWAAYLIPKALQPPDSQTPREQPVRPDLATRVKQRLAETQFKDS
jgi:hypothetical protein